MNLGIIISRIGGIDEVALEAEKWIEVLKKLGHKVFILSGQFENRKIDMSFERRIPEMSLYSPESYWEQKKAFFHPDYNEDDLLEHLDVYSRVIEDKIIRFIEDFNIDILISENSSSLPSHMSQGVAIKRAVNKFRVPTIVHSHTFAWERDDRYISPHKRINKLVNDTFPLSLSNCYHVVTCSDHKNLLKEKFDLESHIIPYVMDFMSDNHIFNDKILSTLDIQLDDIVLAQVTRIVEHKGIENTINLLGKLNDPKIKLLITGSYSDDAGGKYYQMLLDLIAKLNLHNNVIFGNQFFINSNSNKYTSFSPLDAYKISRASTIFSKNEGCLNNVVESSYMKKPLIINSYNKTFYTDIIKKGFEFIVTDDNEINSDIINSILDLLYLNNHRRYNDIVENNFEIGKKYFSYNILEENLAIAIENVINL